MSPCCLKFHQNFHLAAKSFIKNVTLLLKVSSKFSPCCYNFHQKFHLAAKSFEEDFIQSFLQGSGGTEFLAGVFFIQIVTNNQWLVEDWTLSLERWHLASRNTGCIPFGFLCQVDEHGVVAGNRTFLKTKYESRYLKCKI